MSGSTHAAAGGVIDITDMRQPRLTELQRQAVENAPEVELEESVVLELARQATGLADFGDEDFRERLRLWLKCARDDRELSRLGRATIFGMAVRYAGVRLRIEDLVRRHPEILDIPIERPLVIAGLPRSGTTHLQNFLAADKRLRSLPYWEAIRPVPAPDEIAAPGEEDPRHAKCAVEWARADALLPYSKAMHEFSPDHISEDVEFSCVDFGSYHIEWLTFSPEWRDYCLSHDQTGIYRYLKKCLQVLNFLTGSKRWLMKCPQHMEQLVPLTTVFPDATVVITHRDPIGSIQSAITNNCYRQRISRTRVCPDETAEYWIDRYERLLRACVRDRDKLDPDRTVDVYFDRFMEAPMATVEEVYVKAGLTLDQQLRADMAAFLDANPRGKHGKVHYDLRRDFGLTPEEVRERFEFYFERFPVKVEVT
ncbi:MAG: hypothetical protein JWQ97_2559 [Phenylobacterium sp.]|nr:hypothetical protein [Phenylobacterium sp.]